MARELAGRGHASVKAIWVVTQDDVRERAPLPADWPSATTAMVDEIQERLRTIGEVDAAAVSGGCDEELAKLSRGYRRSDRRLPWLWTGSLPVSRQRLQLPGATRAMPAGRRSARRSATRRERAREHQRRLDHRLIR